VLLRDGGMTSRERVARTLSHQTPDRVPLYDQFWMETQRAYRDRLGCPLPRYHRSGIDWGDNHLSAIHGTLWEIFDFDIIEVGWPMLDLYLGRAEILEETEAHVLLRDGHLSERRWWKHRQGTPEHVGFWVNSPDRWRQVKDRLAPGPERFRWDEMGPLYRRARQQNRFICYGTVEVIEAAKDVIGHEMMCRAMIRWPDWIHDLFDTYCRLQIEQFRLFEAAGYRCDGAFIYGDIAYKNGPFMSPAHYREFVLPYHRRLIDEFRQRNMPVLFHSDGDVRPLIPAFLEAGVSALNPLEAKAGLDVRELAPQYGDRLTFCGNIDVRVLATNDREQILAELQSKLAAVMPYRAYIYHSDHSVPPDVSFETYCFVLDEVRRLGRYE
jgi:uroporphyrinogen decarboxylase